MLDLTNFAIAETLSSADELGIHLSLEDAKAIAQTIVTTKFSVCVRQYLKDNYYDQTL